MDKMDTRKDFGFYAETVATHYLQQKNYTILERNYRKPWGEIDIIAQYEDIIVFVEVKANTKDYGMAFNPEVRVDQKKLGKIIKTASLYLEFELKELEHEWRIDIVSVTIQEGTQKAKITHFKNIAESFF